MNWETVEGKWEQMKGQVKEAWGKLTDNDLTQIRGQKDQLVGKIRERYGVEKEDAEEQIQKFCRNMKNDETMPSVSKTKSSCCH